MIGIDYQLKSRVALSCLPVSSCREGVSQPCAASAGCTPNDPKRQSSGCADPRISSCLLALHSSIMRSPPRPTYVHPYLAPRTFIMKTISSFAGGERPCRKTFKLGRRGCTPTTSTQSEGKNVVHNNVKEIKQLQVQDVEAHPLYRRLRPNVPDGHSALRQSK